LVLKRTDYCRFGGLPEKGKKVTQVVLNLTH
jgi:hypothetical protein